MAQEVWDGIEFTGALGMLWEQSDDRLYFMRSLEWKKLMSETKTATQYSWQRLVPINQNTELNLFADVSEEACGAIEYIVTRNGPDDPEGQMWHMMAKGKIEPLQKVAKRHTIQKGELLAIVITANLVCFL